jgi:hypothetical protein
MATVVFLGAGWLAAPVSRRASGWPPSADRCPPAEALAAIEAGTAVLPARDG